MMTLLRGWRTTTTVAAVVILFGAVVALFSAPPTPTGESENGFVEKFPNVDSNVSIVELLADPHKYHGKKVLISGYLRLEFEGNAIYMFKDAADYGMTRYGLWVAFKADSVPGYDKRVGGPPQFDQRYVKIEGRFNKERLGHGGMWQGTIESIDRIWELRRDCGQPSVKSKAAKNDKGSSGSNRDK